MGIVNYPHLHPYTPYSYVRILKYPELELIPILQNYATVAIADRI
jgi:hypothetical protein